MREGKEGGRQRVRKDNDREKRRRYKEWEIIMTGRKKEIVK